LRSDVRIKCRETSSKEEPENIKDQERLLPISWT